MQENVNFKEISVHETPDQSPGFLLWQVSTAWRRAIELRLDSMGLTHPQFVVLATLGWLTRNGDRVTQVSLGKMAKLDPNTLSQIIRGLEKKELVRRVRSTDKRAKNPTLTAKGTQLLKRALPAVESEDKEFFRPWTGEEVRQMTHLFQKLTQ